MVYRTADIVVIIAGGLADYHIVGIGISQGDAPLIQGIVQPGFADDKHMRPRHLTGNEIRSGLGTGVEMALVHIKPHALELLLKLLG